MKSLLLQKRESEGEGGLAIILVFNLEIRNVNKMIIKAKKNQNTVSIMMGLTISM